MRKPWARVITGASLLALIAVPLYAQRSASICEQPARRANLAFQLKDLGGKTIDLSAYKGKVVLLDFWATWCGPCKFEIPGFIELYSKYQSQGLQVLGFAVDEPPSTLQPYVDEMKMNYPVLLGEGREDVQEAYGPLVGLPTTFIIDRAGNICQSHTGFTAKDKFEAAIRALL